MWPYWILFLIPATIAYTSKPLLNMRIDGVRHVKVDAGWLFVTFAISLMIGLRDRVGGDWFNYFNYLFRAQNMSVREALLRADPGYEILNVLSVQMGLGIVGVNLFCGFVFALGLVLYCRSMPRPWLALAVAIPYMTVVVSMGYSRQGVALGFALIGLVALGRERFLWFVFWIFLAATFHRSAVLLIGLALLTLNFRKFSNLPILFLAASLMYSAFLEGRTDQLVAVYIDAEMESGGAFIRLLMNAVPAIIFLKYRKRLMIAVGERRLYTIMAFGAVASFLALVGGLIPSTALDRTALYLLPLQVYVFSHLPDALGKQGALNQPIVMGILVFYAVVLFVWLNFGNFSKWWLPYRMFPTIDVMEAVQQRR
jgi:hypothetical protein